MKRVEIANDVGDQMIELSPDGVCLAFNLAYTNISKSSIADGISIIEPSAHGYGSSVLVVEAKSSCSDIVKAFTQIILTFLRIHVLCSSLSDYDDVDFCGVIVAYDKNLAKLKHGVYNGSFTGESILWLKRLLVNGEVEVTLKDGSLLEDVQKHMAGAVENKRVKIRLITEPENSANPGCISRKLSEMLG